MEAAVRHEPFALTAAKVVAIYDGVETHEDLSAAHEACDCASHTFDDGDRGRVVRAMVAATRRICVGRAPKCADCG
jgi:hypothetical protein